LTVKGRRGFALDAVSFTVHRGEILGIAAVAGNGQDELFEALVGVRPAEPGAQIILDGTLVTGLSPTAIAAEGVAMCRATAGATGSSPNSRSPRTFS
jgi:simple sugar transport system ATP-binding protein